MKILFVLTLYFSFPNLEWKSLRMKCMFCSLCTENSKETVSEDQTVKNNKLLREQSESVKRVPAWEAEIIEKKQKEYAIKQARKAAYCSNVEVFGLIKKSEKILSCVSE